MGHTARPSIRFDFLFIKTLPEKTDTEGHAVHQLPNGRATEREKLFKIEIHCQNVKKLVKEKLGENTRSAAERSERDEEDH